VPAGTIPVTATRRTIARQMVKSRQETVPVTLTAWADATALLAERARLKEAHGSAAASLNDLILKIVAELLAVQGKSVDVGGYYKPDNAKADAALRPSATFNAILTRLN
jgi:monomeric isocitrate dehydrogenase